jgi:hypothetical protein
VQLVALQAKVDSLTRAIRDAFAKGEKKYEELGVDAFVTAIDTAEKAEQDKALAGLLLEAHVAQGQLAVEQAAVDAAHAELGALDDRIAGLQRALDALVHAEQSLNNAGCNDKAAAKTVAEALESSCGVGVASAILEYANAFTIGFNPARAAQLRYIGAIDSGSLAQAAAVMQAWDDVLGVPIDLLARYHAGGIKPAELAQLIVQGAGFAGLIATTAVRAAK